VADPTSSGSGSRREPEPPWRPPPPRRFVGRILLALGLVGTGLVLIVTIGIHRDEDAGGGDTVVVQEQRPQPRAEIPQPALAAPVDRLNASDQAELDRWAEQLADSTEIPARVLVAYGRAEMWMRSAAPDCNLSWGTLAGIGRVESRHGTISGDEIGADGTTGEPIVGVPLNGSEGVRAIPDSDGGRLDGDTRWDRAVGPMQFLPATWAKWGTRAGSDGVAPDPQNIDDAALSAATYLCSGGADLSTPRGWWDAVLAYNASVEYAQDVLSGADAYAEASAG
jgi:membrane-bound lytic murein transglycosylase B